MNYEGINQSIDKDRIESLRVILEKVHNQPFSYEEVQEIADTMLSFYDILSKPIELNQEVGVV